MRAFILLLWLGLVQASGAASTSADRADSTDAITDFIASHPTIMTWLAMIILLSMWWWSSMKETADPKRLRAGVKLSQKDSSMDSEITEHDASYIRNEVAKEREDEKTWGIIKMLIIGFLVISYGAGLFLQWGQTMHLTRIFWKVLFLNAVICFPVMVLLLIQVKTFTLQDHLKTVVVAVLSASVPAIAVLSMTKALSLEVAVYHKPVSGFFSVVWWLSIFMVGRSPFVLHRIPKMMVRTDVKEVFSIVNSQRAARAVCFFTFAVCFFSEGMNHKISGLSWLKPVVGWFAQ